MIAAAGAQASDTTRGKTKTFGAAFCAAPKPVLVIARMGLTMLAHRHVVMMIIMMMLLHHHGGFGAHRCARDAGYESDSDYDLLQHVLTLGP